MGLPQEYKDRLKTLVKRETVTLPELELEVVVRGLTGGEVSRLSSAERSEDMQIAMTTERTDSVQLWNPNSRQDLDEIAELSLLDRATLIQVGNRLSGMGKLQALVSRLNASSSTNSPSPSEEPSAS